MSATHDNESGYIAECETPHGYWWRYRHGDGEPGDMLEAAIEIAGKIAAREALNRGKTYYVARAATGADAVYVFACDHPDGRAASVNVMFEVMFEFTPAGERIRRPAMRRAARH
jgi:hypothetical protein